MKRTDLGREYTLFEDRGDPGKNIDSFREVNALPSYQHYTLSYCPFCGGAPSVLAEFFGDTEKEIEDSMYHRCEKAALIRCERCGVRSPIFMKVPLSEGKKRGLKQINMIGRSYEGPVSAAISFWSGGMHGIVRNLYSPRTY